MGSGIRRRATSAGVRIGSFMIGARIELQSDSHSLHRGHDIAEEDGGIHPEPPDRLESHLCCQIGGFGEGKEVHLLPNGSVLREVTTRLPHDPNRRVGNRLPAAGSEEGCLSGELFTRSALPHQKPHPRPLPRRPGPGQCLPRCGPKRGRELRKDSEPDKHPGRASPRRSV